jgi:GNAT superfamily N-acetyltransferase
MDIAPPKSDAEWQQARELVQEYATSLNVDLSFQDLAHELEHLATEYGPPSGEFLIAREGGLGLACVGLRKFDDTAGEMKRLYVRPAGRGRGLGRLLVESILAKARELGYTRVLLDTLPSMTEARALYTSMGFTPTDPYRFNPVPGTAFLELRLR